MKIKPAGNLAILDEPVTPDDGRIHDSRCTLRRLRAKCEEQITPDFNQPLSLLIDDLVQLEEALYPVVDEVL